MSAWREVDDWETGCLDERCVAEWTGGANAFVPRDDRQANAMQAADAVRDIIAVFETDDTNKALTPV